MILSELHIYMILNTFTEERIKELVIKLNSSSKKDMKSGQKIAIFFHYNVFVTIITFIFNAYTFMNKLSEKHDHNV